MRVSRPAVVWSVGAVLCVSYLALAVRAQPPAGPRPALSGTVRMASRTVMEGVAVSARATNRPMTTTVFTDQQGVYVFPPMDGGTYRVGAQAAGYEAARAKVTLDTAQTTRQEFTLNPIKDFTLQLSASEWLEALPERTFEDRRLKEIFRVQCTECHQASLVLQNRFDEQGWLAIIGAMEPTGRWDKGLKQARSTPSKPIQFHKAELAKWLAKMRGPGPSPMKMPAAPRRRPSGEAARVVITEYDVPPAHTPTELVPGNGSDWSEGSASWINGGRGLHDVAIDVNGNAWVTNWHANTNAVRTLMRIDHRTGHIKAFGVPDGRGGAATGHGIVADPNGTLWFNADARLGRVDPATEQIDMFTPPVGLSIGGTLDTDKDGNVWVGTNHGALVFDPKKKTFRYFQNVSIGGATYGIATDVLGNAWWGLWTNDKVGHADVKTGKTYEIRMRPADAPGPASYMTPLDREFYLNNGALTFMPENHVPGSQVPRRLGADKNGSVVWVANWWGGNLARIDIKTRKATYHYLPYKGLQPYSATVDGNHMVYMNTNDDAVAKLDPKTGEWTVFLLPSHGTEVKHIMTDSRRGDVWVVYAATSRVARLQFRTQAQIKSLQSNSTEAQASR